MGAEMQLQEQRSALEWAEHMGIHILSYPADMSIACTQDQFIRTMMSGGMMRINDMGKFSTRGGYPMIAAQEVGAI